MQNSAVPAFIPLITFWQKNHCCAWFVFLSSVWEKCRCFFLCHHLLHFCPFHAEMFVHRITAINFPVLVPFPMSATVDWIDIGPSYRKECVEKTQWKFPKFLNDSIETTHLWCPWLFFIVLYIHILAYKANRFEPISDS